MTRDMVYAPFVRLLILILASLIVVVAESYYDLLEVPRHATKSEIKKSWRKLSMKYHPDKNPGDEEAAEYYKKINRAYEVLSDDDKR